MCTEQEVIDGYLTTHKPYQTRCVGCGRFMPLSAWDKPYASKFGDTWWVGYGHDSHCNKCLGKDKL